jgi:two-component system sensor histidine kinase ChiS
LHLLEKESILDVKLGNHVQKTMTILFADIRSFTSLSESMTPEENFIFLNGYLRYVSPVIRRHNGFIDKYIGDAMMALFPEKVDDALGAAIEMHRELETFNQHRYQQQLKPIRIGVGLHTGLLTLGTIGEENRMESTVISDAVNLASRIEGLTKLYGSSIIVSEQVLNQLADPQHYEYRFLGKLRVKGKQQPVNIFEIIDSDPADVRAVKINLKHLFDSALNSYYERNFVQAAGKFFHILTQHKEDRATSFYIRRCEYYMKHGVPKDWDGVENIDEK